VSGYVALCRPLPGAVVTYFVTGSGTLSLVPIRPSPPVLPTLRRSPAECQGPLAGIQIH
jgi:hypothetical protein